MWLSLIPSLAAAAAILLLPGLAGGWISGFRGIRLFALAAPVTASFLAVLALIFPIFGLKWTPWTVLPALFVLAAIIGFALRKFSRTPVATWKRTSLQLVTPLAGGLVSGIVVARAIGAPEDFSQAFDNVFHLNAVRFVLDSGSASPLTLGLMVDPGATSAFYPAGWHGLNALVAALAGSGIAEAVNAVTILLTVIVWPVGLLFLAQTLFGARLRVSIAVGIVVPALLVFPMHLLFFGPLYPMILGIALLPPLAALTLELALPTTQRALPAPAALVIIVGLLGGIANAHPGVLLAWLVFANLVLLIWALRFARTSSNKTRWALAGIVAVMMGASALLLWVLRPEDQESIWGPTTSPLGAIKEIVTASLFDAPISFISAALTVLGLLILWRQRNTAPSNTYLLAWYAVFGFLFFVSASQQRGALRMFLLGPWYQDPNRLGTLAVIPLAMVMTAGFVFLLGKLEGLSSRAWKIAAFVTLCAVGIANWFGPGTSRLIQMTAPNFALTENSALISIDEFKLLQRLDAVVPEDAMVAGNVWQGAGMAYMLSDRQVIAPHLFFAPTDDRTLILNELNEATPGSEVCDAIERLNVQYVLDFPGPAVFGAGVDYPGLHDLSDSSAVELVDQEGEAKLFRVTGCG